MFFYTQIDRLDTRIGELNTEIDALDDRVDTLDRVNHSGVGGVVRRFNDSIEERQSDRTMAEYMVDAIGARNVIRMLSELGTSDDREPPVSAR